MKTSIRLKSSVVAIAFLATFLMGSPVFAESIFVIGQGSNYVGGSGWYAGHVITGVSGT